MRKSFWELATEFAGVENELWALNELFNREMYCTKTSAAKTGVKYYINRDSYLQWAAENAITSPSIGHLFRRLGLDGLIKRIDAGGKIKPDEFLLYMETLYNLVRLANTKTQWSAIAVATLVQIRSSIEANCARLGYEIQKRGDRKYIIVEKDAAATAVADKYAAENQDFSFKVIEYNHFILRGNIDRKREILLAIGQKFESVRPQLESGNFKDVAKDAGLLLNKLNIRHNNTSPDSKSYNAVVAQMPPKELEVWYDKTYSVLLLALLADDFSTLHKEIKELKAQIETK
ncbi:MAG: hypothetical protein IJS01_10405 [Lentisphaeria bacterium]|nr:hypothetical protein [Lentisphaeria bacterium]